MKSGLTMNQRDFHTQKDAVTRLVLKAKTDYLSSKAAESQTRKQLFSVTNSLLGKSNVSPHPTSIPAVQLPHSFCEFFTEKIKQIRQNLDKTPSPHIPTVVPDIATPLVQFSPVSVKEVHNILKKIAQKTCKLDPLPTSLLCNNIDLLLPALTNIINRSFLSREGPSEFKPAVVRPLPNQMKNYRPVSNLPFISKILEKVVLMQLTNHLTSNHLTHKFQSAYRADHSTETAFLRIVNDILTASYASQVSNLTPLDLSTASDTIDHSILLCRLEQHLNVSGLALSLFKSCLLYTSDAADD